MKCFYHSADLDGHCSGAIVKHRFPECEMIGIDYGQEFPWDTISQGEKVIMIDFSLQPFVDMYRLDALADLTWIDHHKSAIDDYETGAYRHGDPLKCEAVLNTEFSACELAWKTYFPDEPMPEGVFMLGRYDIWKHHEHTGCLEYQYGMRAMGDTKPGAPIWEDILAGKHTGMIVNDGITILQYEKNTNAKFMEAFAFETELDGLRCIAANRGMTSSQLFESVYDPAKHDLMMPFAWKNGKYTVSLYSAKPEVDCSVIAKAHGGGGHKGAAGFQCAELPFIAPA